MHIIVLEIKPISHYAGQALSRFDVCRGLAQRRHTSSLIYTQKGNLFKEYKIFCKHAEYILANYLLFGIKGI